MGGGGSGGTFVNRSPEELRDLVRKAEDKTTVAAFEAELARLLGTLLGEYNGRDVEMVQNRLDDLKTALEGSIEGTFDQLFGGSVAKHTYVDGLSDIDSLILINDTDLEGKSPEIALARMGKTIQRHLGGQATVSHGRMAVTVAYGDGMVIQLLPAIRTNDGHVKVPSSRTGDWSKINPVTFQEALTRRNRECGGKLVPTIKLAKAINGQLPEAQRLSGYHMESLGIAIFRNYAGEKTTSAMLPTFLERARELVLSPIHDSTGQSVHVDGYLGPANSDARQAASHLLGRLARRMRNATAAGSTAQWQALFGLDQ
ncbi:MAG: nucleotidyltransferase [Pyrinomonadaceae bacterium]|nr:nucleotidyltransferase [Pyrinomonadaceae bacterium]